MDAVYTEYFQKSKVFLYPLLNLKKGLDFVPIETYISWDGVYETSDYKVFSFDKDKPVDRGASIRIGYETMKNKKGYFASHIGLILGIIFIFFPVWLTFVASTVTQEDILKPPFPLLPGPHFFENYSYALFEGTPEGYGKNIPVLKLLFNLCIGVFILSTCIIFFQ